MMAEKDVTGPDTEDFDDEWAKISGEELADELEAGDAAEDEEAIGGSPDEPADDDEVSDEDADEKAKAAAAEAEEEKSAEGVDKSEEIDDNAGEDDSSDDPLQVALQKIKELEHRFSSERGRQVGLQQELRKLREEKAALEARLREGTQADLPEDWKELEEKYPAIAKAVASKIDADKKRVDEEMEALRARTAKAEADKKLREDWAYLDEHNPGWRDVINSTEFKGWLDKQTQNIKNLYASNEVQDNSELMKLYTGSFTPPAQTTPAPAAAVTETSSVSKRQKQLESGTRIPSSSVDVEDLEDEDFDSVFAQAASKEDKRLRGRH